MKTVVERSNIQILLITLISGIVVLLASCERKVDTIKKTYILTLPSITVKDNRTVVDDSGKVQLVMTFPLMQSYENDESPYSEFIHGIKVTFYDGQKDPVATATSKYAKYTEKKKLWELKDSVVVINNTNDKLETEQLFWDQDKQLIFTDRFVKITNEDQTVMGSGFESDVRLTRRKIKNITGTIYLKNE